MAIAVPNLIYEAGAPRIIFKSFGGNHFELLFSETGYLDTTSLTQGQVMAITVPYIVYDGVNHRLIFKTTGNVYWEIVIDDNGVLDTANVTTEVTT